MTENQVENSVNVVAGRAGEGELMAHLHLPPNDHVRPCAAIVVVHGGGWRKGSPKGVRGFGQYLSQHGFVCLCPAYRLSGEAHWPAQIEDVKCSIRYLRANAEKLGLDPDRIGIIGDSAGGQLALMSAVHSEFEGNGGFDSHSSHVKTVAAMYGPVRVKSTRANGEPLGLLAADATQADYDKASPITYDLSDFPPCLLIHGAEDPAVPLSGTLELYTKLTKLNRECELHVFAGEGHAFDRRSSTQEGMVDIMDESSIYGPTVMRLIAQFFEKYL